MKEFHAKHKQHIRLWIVLAAMTVVSGVIAYSGGQQQPISATQPLQLQVTEIVSAGGDKKPAPNAPQTETTSLPNQPVGNEPDAPTTIPLTLVINETSYPIEILPGQTVYDCLQTAQNQGRIQFSAREYGGDLGYLVEEINGVKNSVRDKKYWIYYINNQKATVGVSNYKPIAHDIISWKYEDEE